HQNLAFNFFWVFSIHRNLETQTGILVTGTSCCAPIHRTARLQPDLSACRESLGENPGHKAAERSSKMQNDSHDPERRPLVLVNPSDSPDEQQEAIEEPNNVAQRSPVTVLAQHPSPLYKLLGYFTILFTFALSVIASLNQAQEESSKHEDASEKSDNSSHHGSLSTAEMFSLWMESLLLLGGIGAFIYLTFRVILDKTIDRAELVNPYDPNNRLPEIGAVHWCLKMPHHLAKLSYDIFGINTHCIFVSGIDRRFIGVCRTSDWWTHASGAALAALTVKCILLTAFVSIQLSGMPVDEIKRSISEDYQVSLVDRILAGRIRNLHPRLADIGALLLIICNAAEWFIYGSAFSLILGYRNDDPVNLSLAIVTLPLHVFFYFHSIGCLYDFKEYMHRPRNH
uniref:DUF599 domain-containing protein n=1 Tax=Macrostomum lignano TaxID=282301 RepID=A0A1I8IWM9_9PLAT